MILLAAALSGFAVLALEVLGVHELAPWFGTSALVWTNQIGVVLLAMAAGGWLGGKRAKSHPQPMQFAGLLLGAGGLLIGAGVWLLPWFAQFWLPEQLTLDEAAPLFLTGSMVSALLLFAPPVFLLSMVSPLLVESKVRAGGEQSSAGQAAGSVNAAGTVGSLLGVFGSSLLAIPLLGTRLTLILTAVCLLLASAILLRGAQRRATALVAPLCFLSLLGGDAAATAHLPSEARVLARTETPLQVLRVIEWPGGERWLQMNEGVDSYQSIWFPDHRSYPGGYYDLFALTPGYSGIDPVVHQQQVRYWVLGLAAGSGLAPVQAALGDLDWHCTGVEIDARLVDFCTEWMPLAPNFEERLTRIAGGDGRAMLRAASPGLDFVILDAYTNQFEIPLHLATEEFFAEVHAKLRHGGVLAINLGTSEGVGHGFVAAIREAVASAFGESIRVHRVSRSRNLVLFARRGMELPAGSEVVRSYLPAAPPSLAAAVLAGQTLDGRPESSPFPLRDGRNPLAWEQARLWLQTGS